MTVAFFNLLTSSIFSLAAGLVVVSFFVWFFKINTGPWKLFLLYLPFVKIIYDCLRGIPAQSVLYTQVDLFALPPNSQTFFVGGGFSSYWCPDYR